MYKDQDRRRQTERERQRRYRSRRDGHDVTPKESVTPVDVTPSEKVIVVTIKGSPLVAHSPTCRCLMCRPQ